MATEQSALWGVLMSIQSNHAQSDARPFTGRFPPVLVLTHSEAQALPLFVSRPAEARLPVACQNLEANWPSWVSEVQQALRAPSEQQFLAQAAILLARIDKAQAACPQWAAPLALQRALLRENHGLYASTRAADGAAEAALPKEVGRSLLQLRHAYESLHDGAWQAASHDVTRSWAAWCAQASCGEASARKQRYLINLTRDAALVDDARTPSDPHFSALARVAVLGEVSQYLLELQGQGPCHPTDVAAYIDACVAEAQRYHAGTVIFANAASPQIPSFAQAIAARAGAEGPLLRYLDLSGWQDGSTVTPEGAGDFALRLVREVEASETRALLVTNCNAGLDRSGTVNALVQALLLARRERRAGAEHMAVVAKAMARVPNIVAGLKKARPGSISSLGRYVFVHQALAAALKDHGLPTNPCAL